MFIVVMTAAHISPNVFSLQTFLPMYSEQLIITHIAAHIHIYTSHSYVHSHLCITLYDPFMNISHLHFFCSLWQAGCSRLIVSDTLHAHAECQCCMFMLHVHAACSSSMCTLHVHATCLCCLSMLHFLVACQMCMSVLHVHAT
jgi:hypothetical protein